MTTPANLQAIRRERRSRSLAVVALVLGVTLALFIGPHRSIPVVPSWRDGLAAILQTAVGSMLQVLLGFAVLLLPGYGAMQLLKKRPRSLTEHLVMAVVASILIVGTAGGAAVAFGVMTRWLMVLVVTIPAVFGIRPLLRWCRQVVAQHLTTAVLIGLLTTPWWFLLSRTGYAPADTLKWWYWDLAKYLSQTRGIPSWVSEYGMHVRWLPDYLVFNLVSETYAGLARGLPDADLLQPLSLTVVVLSLAFLYATLRLWMHRRSAYVVLAALAASTLWTTKFNTYKPEALGVVVGLAAVWLVVTGLRQRRPGLLLLAGVAIGVNIAIHAVAASVLALLMVAAGVAEIMVDPDGRIRRTLLLVIAAMIAMAAVVSIGIGLQGRAFVTADATNPALDNGSDPTWDFLQLSNGIHDPATVPQLADQVRGSLARVWRPWMPWTPGLAINVTSPWILVPLAVGLVLAMVVGDRKTRSGTLSAIGFGLLLTAVAIVFALAFDTYVPRHTGLTRMSQYSPLPICLLGGLALEGYRALLDRWRTLVPLNSVALIALLGFVATLGGAIAIQLYSERPALSETGIRSLEAIGVFSDQGDRILANSTTTGQIEFSTGRDALLEGRQPLIEDKSFLLDTNALLRSAMAFFDSPNQRFAIDNSVDWILINNDPRDLGAAATFGGTVEQFRLVPWLTEVWSDDGAALFHTKVHDGELRYGPAELHRRTAALAALIFFIALVVAIGASRRISKPWATATDRHPADLGRRATEAGHSRSSLNETDGSSRGSYL